MAKAGFSVIRVGESVWSTWEPEDGRFELDWLAPVLDAAHRHDIGVILGTPTYAVPMWLTRCYPEIAAETASGHRVGWVLGVVRGAEADTVHQASVPRYRNPANLTVPADAYSPITRPVKDAQVSAVQ